jgi:tetratricopeptide (TPR) repeat protein
VFYNLLRDTSWIFRVVVLLSVAVSPVVSAQTQGSDYQTAVSLVQQGRFDLALPLVQRILERSPGDLKARNLMGIALSAAGRREEANEHFKKLLEADPSFVPAIKNLALNELALGLVKEAQAHFEQALRLSPGDPASHFGIAEIEFSRRNFEAAAAHYERSGDLVIRNPVATTRFAASYAEIGRRDKAASLLAGIPLEGDSDLQLQAGLVFASMGMFDDAAQRLQLALNRTKQPYQAGVNLTMVLVKKGEYAQAIKVGEEMLARGYGKAALYSVLSQAYEHAGRTNEAYESLRKATELEPQTEAHYLDLVILCIKHDNYDLGLQIADVGVRRIPRSQQLHFQRGAVLAMKGRFEDAESEFRVSAELSPEPGLSHVATGLMLIQRERLAEAIELLRRESARNPNDPFVFWFLGEALSNSGITPGSDIEKEALAVLERAIQLHPQLPRPRTLLGKLLFRNGQFDRAIEQLEKALELDSEDMTAAYQLALALRQKGETERARQLFSMVEKANTAARDLTRRNLLRLFKNN